MPDLAQKLRDALRDTYAIQREIGAGGMATVYLAHDVRHDRDVALKVLHPDLANALGPERFQREIRLAARLQHPHILTVLDSGESAGQLWFTMPYVDGESLRDRLTRETQLPVADALRIAREAAQALQYAHQHGVVHRDIKPENLLLTEDGNTLVADFGIARSFETGGGSRLTETGLALGTPAYMSPEQASGERELTARTDIYSLGAVLYEMLSGEPPFTGPTAQAIIAKRFAGDVPDVRRTRSSVPEVVGHAVSQALALVPADRFASAADFARALDLSTNSTSVSETASVQEPIAKKGEKSKTSATNRSHARQPLFATLVLGVAIGLGLLFGWSRYRALPSARIGDTATGSEIRLAVLPFDNLGDTSNAYFADGIADQLRGKLTQLSGLTVIARTSSVGYRGTHTTPQQIAHELGVRYLLTGTVSWAKGPNGESRVQVNPELVEVTDSSAPASKWQQPFDASLTDVFKVQADIATQVANALGVALAIGAQKELAERPTKNLAAYDAFLRGESLYNQVASSDPASLRQSLKYYQQATTLDPSFANAWTRIATVASLLYVNSVPTRAAANLARDAAARVRELAPNSALAHVAAGFYEGFVRQNADDALAEYEAALRIDPTDPTLMNRTASAQLAQGHWDSALSLVRRAQNLDPRSVSITSRLATSSLWLRHYAEAQQAGDRAMALAPTSLTAMQNRVMVALSGGDLSGARAIIAASPAGLDQDVLVSYVAEYWDLYWVLTDAQQRRLLGLSPATFDNDRGSWGLCLAEVYRMRGDNARSLVYADSARIALEQQLKETPNDAQIHVLLAVALAYLGHSAEAIKEGERATALDPVSSNAITGPYSMHELMRVYILGGQKEKALDLLEQLLKMPYYLSPAWIRIDPTFAPLKGDPRFERLANGSA